MKQELEIIRLKKANNFLEMSIPFLNESDLIFVKNIIKKNTEDINNYNNKNLKIINPTKKELGQIRASLKKIVFAFYINPIIKKHNFKFNFSEKYINHNPNLKNQGCWCDDCCNEYAKQEEAYELVYNPIRILTSKINEACDNTIIPKNIIDAKILLSRKNPNYWTGNDKLDYELSEYLKIKMLESFNEQNKEFCKTINL